MWTGKFACSCVGVWVCLYVAAIKTSKIPKTLLYFSLSPNHMPLVDYINNGNMYIQHIDCICVRVYACVSVGDILQRLAGIPYCVRVSGFACWFGKNVVFSCFHNIIKIVNIAYYINYWREFLEIEGGGREQKVWYGMW